MQIRSVLVVGYLFLMATVGVAIASPAGRSGIALQRSVCDGLSGTERRDCLHAEVVAQTKANKARAQQENERAVAGARTRADAEKVVRDAANAASAAKQKAERDQLAYKAMDGCKAGALADCSRVLDLVRGSPLALQASLQGCSMKDQRSCYDVGDYYENHSNAPDHVSLAVKSFKDSCENGDRKACVQLKNASLGTQGATAAAEVVQSSEKLCTAGNNAACSRLATSYLWGELTDRDRGKAAQFLDRGCKLGDADSCYTAKQIHDELNKDKRDADRKAAEVAAQNDPKRRSGVDLSKADMACLKEERSQHTTSEQTGRCATYLQTIPGGGQYCPRYETVEQTHTSVTLTNICKRTISVQETCGSSSEGWGTLLPGDVYTRTGASCRLTY